LALVIALFSEEVIAILTPPAYHGAIDIVAILSMYYGILFIGKITGPQLIFAKKTHITSLLTVVSIIVNIGVNIPIIMTWGAVGAAWGTFLVGVITNGISFFVAQHYYEIRWEYLRMGAIFLTLFVFTIVLILLRGAGVDYYLRMPVKLLALCIYGYIGVKIGVIASENLVLVRNLVASCLRT
jgi:O-antigen/teichoic acid export membrane protein